MLTAVFLAIGIAFARLELPRVEPGPSASPSSSLPAASPPLFTPEEARLLAAVPTVLRETCHATEAGEGGSSTAAASLHCPPHVGSGADDAWYESFDATQLLDAAFNRLAPGDVAEGECSPDQTNLIGPWDVGSTFSGQRLCYQRDGESWIVWTYLGSRILARARGNGDDPNAVTSLYDWWYDIAVELRSPVD